MKGYLLNVFLFGLVMSGVGERAKDILTSGGIELKRISAGSFIMGSPLSDSLRGEDEQAHEVLISREFWIGKTEITQSEWFSIMGTTVKEQQAKQKKKWPLRGDGESIPMYLVSWYDCMEFCEKLTLLERGKGTLPAGYVFSLPTEAQWEYACRAGSKDFLIDQLPDMAWYRENSNKQIHPVGLKQPNAWGLYDMQGNVSEWCFDWYGPYPANRVVDPVGPGMGERKIARGGSWFGKAGNARPAKRITDPPDQGFSSMGFRVALVSEAEKR